MSIPLDHVEREVARLWEDEARTKNAVRVELMTLVALVSEPGLLDRASRAVEDVARVHPSRTIVALWKTGDEPGIEADVALHKPTGVACGDAIKLEATGAARDWLPANIERLSLPDLPVCIWWVGDIPDFDDLFDRMVLKGDLAIVSSSDMDLRDLEKLSRIVTRSRDRYALSDLTWFRLRWLQELVARFFDDNDARACLKTVRRVAIEFSPREKGQDVASTQAGLLFGWMANALSLRAEQAVWKRADTWAEATFGTTVARFEQRPRQGVVPGGIVRVSIECDNARFDIERQEDPEVFRWSRDVPGTSTAPQLLRVRRHQESQLLVESLLRPRRDKLLEASLDLGSRIVRPVAPRLSMVPPKG